MCSGSVPFISGAGSVFRCFGVDCQVLGVGRCLGLTGLDFGAFALQFNALPIFLVDCSDFPGGRLLSFLCNLSNLSWQVLLSFL